jgi:hypothetical protein
LHKKKKGKKEEKKRKRLGEEREEEESHLVSFLTYNIVSSSIVNRWDFQCLSHDLTLG